MQLPRPIMADAAVEAMADVAVNADADAKAITDVEAMADAAVAVVNSRHHSCD